MLKAHPIWLSAGRGRQVISLLWRPTDRLLAATQYAMGRIEFFLKERSLMWMIFVFAVMGL